MVKSCELLPHTPLWESLFFGNIFTTIGHMDGKLQAYGSFEMAHLELTLNFFFLHSVDVLKIHMSAHSIFFFKTYL
jgi:hypothetical protein